MKMVAFWQTGDTIVNRNNASETFEVLLAENREAGTWVTLKNFHTNETFSGFESGLQRIGYIAYRKEIFIEAIALR